MRIVHSGVGFVVIDKPAWMLSVPGKGPGKRDCAAARVARMFPESTGPRIVHRLDMETSGLMVFALNPGSQRELSRQFESRVVGKGYVALLDGGVEAEHGVVDLPLRPDPSRRPIQVADWWRGRPARTVWRVLSREIDRTRVEFRPVTGRTHQLRVHAATAREAGGLGHAIIGDALYGGPGAERLMLHASALSFLNPATGRRLDFSSAPEF